ncbi:hypothetical protein Dimus_026554 [Dionaea muscipula]
MTYNLTSRNGCTRSRSKMSMAKQNDIQFDSVEPVHHSEQQDVENNALEPFHRSEERQAAKDTDVAATLVLLTNLAAATSIGTTAATSVGNTELLVAMSVTAKDTDVSTTLVPATGVSAMSPGTNDDRTGDGQNQDTVEEIFKKFLSEQNGFRYIGTLANVDATFFSDFTREEFQLEETIYIEELWKNWDPDSQPDLSQPSKILEQLTQYVWGLNPEWGIKWWNVRHVLAVCLVARSHWVLAHINLEKWTIKIYDSLAHKTPKNPGHHLASFEGMRTLLPLILDEAGYF